MRDRGLIDFSGNFEPQMASPLDGRTRVALKQYLYLPETWISSDGNSYSYKGMIVAVYGDTQSNNGIYELVGDDVSLQSSWIASSVGSSAISTITVSSISDLDNYSIDEGIYVIDGAVRGQLTVITKQESNTLPEVGDMYEGSTVTAVYVSKAECRADIVTADGLHHTVNGNSPTKPTALGSADSGGYVAGLVFDFDGSKYWKTIVASDSTAQLPFKPLSAPDISTGAHYAYASSTNTGHILSAYAAYDGSYAAKYCSDLVVNGYSDWQLPTLSGLGDNINLKYLPSLPAGTVIWSSDADSGAVACVGRWDGTAMTIATSGDIAFEDKDTLELVLPTKVVQVIASSDITWLSGVSNKKQILVTGDSVMYRDIS